MRIEIAVGWRADPPFEIRRSVSRAVGENRPHHTVWVYCPSSSFRKTINKKQPLGGHPAEDFENSMPRSIEDEFHTVEFSDKDNLRRRGRNGQVENFKWTEQTKS